MPSYQSAAVNEYLTNSPPPYPSYSTTNNENIGANGGIFNRAGRGYPDVSAIGDNVVIFNNVAPTLSMSYFLCPLYSRGNFVTFTPETFRWVMNIFSVQNTNVRIPVGGTSAAAPAFASILNLINEERIAANKSTVGFVNPTLYANPQVLHDITSGTNPGCNTTGFSASAGWDPVTGLGTPNYPKMLELFMSLD